MSEETIDAVFVEEPVLADEAVVEEVVAVGEGEPLTEPAPEVAPEAPVEAVEASEEAPAEEVVA